MKAIGDYNKMDTSWKKIIHYNFYGNYLCNRKCNVYSQKMTKKEENVTCGPCMLRLKMNSQVVKVKEEIKTESKGRNGRKNYNPRSQEDLNFLRRKIK